MPSSQNGKKQNTGVYYTNGIQYRNVSHKYFKPGTRVIKNKTGEVGIVLKKNVKGPRSLIRVQFDNIEYVYSNLLHIEDYYSNEQSRQCNRYPEYRNNKNNKNKDNLERLLLRDENKKKIKNFNEAKKKLREDILNNGLYVSNINGKYNFDIKVHSDNEIVNNINKLNLQKIINYDKMINSTSSLAVNESRLTKYQLLKIFYLSNCKSTQVLIPYVSNKSDYYTVIEKYRLSLIEK